MNTEIKTRLTILILLISSVLSAQDGMYVTYDIFYGQSNDVMYSLSDKEGWVKMRERYFDFDSCNYRIDSILLLNSGGTPLGQNGFNKFEYYYYNSLNCLITDSIKSSLDSGSAKLEEKTYLSNDTVIREYGSIGNSGHRYLSWQSKTFENDSIKTIQIFRKENELSSFKKRNAIILQKNVFPQIENLFGYNDSNSTVFHSNHKEIHGDTLVVEYWNFGNGLEYYGSCRTITETNNDLTYKKVFFKSPSIPEFVLSEEIYDYNSGHELSDSVFYFNYLISTGEFLFGSKFYHFGLTDSQIDSAHYKFYTFNSNIERLDTAFTRLIFEYPVVHDSIYSVDPEIEFETLRLYPNPNNGQFLIKLDNANVEGYRIQVMNTNGSLLLDQQFTGEKTSIDLSSYDRGVYYVHVFNSEHSFKVEKVLVL